MHKVAGKTGKNTTRVEAEVEAETEKKKGQHHQTVPTLMGSFSIPTAFALKLQLELEAEVDGVGVAIGIGIGMLYAVVWRGKGGVMWGVYYQLPADCSPFFRSLYGRPN